MTYTFQFPQLLLAQIFNAIAEPVVPIGIWSKKSKADIETHPVIVETKINIYSM